MIGVIVTVALDITVSVTWWLTKQITTGTMYTVNYLLS